MRILIDSHVLVWLLNDSRLLGPASRDLLESGVEVNVSLVSIWELGLKHMNGKLPITINELIDGSEQLGLEMLALRPEHLLRYETVKLTHKDPFDTLLVAQAEQEDCVFLTIDKNILASTYRTQNAAE